MEMNLEDALVYEDENINKRPVLFMMVGLPGSGKSFIASSLFVKRNGEYSKPITHSSDVLRKELYGDENDQSNNQKLFYKLHRNIKNDLLAGVDVVYDATNIKKKRRVAFLKELSKIDCYKVCVCVLTPYSLVLRQNAMREREVPSHVIRRMYLNWCPPALDEGFDNVILSYNYGGIEKSKYALDNFFYGETDAIHIDQENSHHKNTIGDHCVDAAMYIRERYPEDITLRTAALLHDIGKVFTKSRLNAKGYVDAECHYYNHQNCGAYDSFFYTDVLNVPFLERLNIANLIYYHMMPFTSWKQSKKAEQRVRDMVGEEFFSKILRLHEADLAAH